MKGWLLVLAPVMGMALGAQDKPAPKIVGVCAAPEGLVVCWDPNGARTDQYRSAVEKALASGKFSRPELPSVGGGASGFARARTPMYRYVLVSGLPESGLTYPGASVPVAAGLTLCTTTHYSAQENIHLKLAKIESERQIALPLTRGAEKEKWRLETWQSFDEPEQTYLFVRPPATRGSSFPWLPVKVVTLDGREIHAEAWPQGSRRVYSVPIAAKELKELSITERPVEYDVLSLPFPAQPNGVVPVPAGVVL